MQGKMARSRGSRAHSRGRHLNAVALAAKMCCALAVVARSRTQEVARSRGWRTRGVKKVEGPAARSGAW